MGEDKELDLLTAKKLLELKKKLTKKPKEETSRDLVLSRLVDRGEEVLTIAEKSYPKNTAIVVDKLAELIKSGDLKGYISGGELLWLFRKLGMNIRIETKIMVKEDGRLIPIKDKLKSD
ncbi:MAG: double-stranded DNA-binding protein [archaeon]|nr:double-stranded DNA-binding protein [archaeon]MCP8316271.1 double-stranded DNA-binding protein [archaeon]MCP8320377.1 double-stranded DNA-binding protein [archaeon]